jgi:hypothetical protein
MKQFKPSFIAVLFILLFSTSAFASHIRGGFIHVEQKDINSLEMIITIYIYKDMKSLVPVGEGSLDFGDGSEPVIIPNVTAIPLPELGHNYGIVSYTTTYTYKKYGTYTISYSEPNRNFDIVNIKDSHNTKFHIQTTIITDAEHKVNTSAPLLDLFHIFQTGRENTLALTMRRIHQEVYVYHLATPLKGRKETVSYRYPKHIHLNPVSGEFTWDLTQEEPEFKDALENVADDPRSGSEFTFTALINQYRRKNNEFVISSVTRIDFQIAVLKPVDQIESTEVETEYVIENNEQVSFEKTYSSSSLPQLMIANDLPGDSFSFTTTNNSDEETQSTTVAIEVLNENMNVDGPYALVVRNKVNYTMNDEVFIFSFNEPYEYPYSIITSVTHELDGQMTVFPNPSNGRIYFHLDPFDEMELKLFNTDGSIILRKRIGSGDEVSINNKGVFIYMLRSDNGFVKTGKVVVN